MLSVVHAFCTVCPDLGAALDGWRLPIDFEGHNIQVLRNEEFSIWGKMWREMEEEERRRRGGRVAIRDARTYSSCVIHP